MGLRFFADQCVPISVIEPSYAGYEVLYLRDYLPIESPGNKHSYTSLKGAVNGTVDYRSY